MYTKQTQIINKSGLHARPASGLALKAKEFSSVITIRDMDAAKPMDIDAKSIMKVLAASIKKGARVEVCAEGEDERQAVEALVGLLETGE